MPKSELEWLRSEIGRITAGSRKPEKAKKLKRLLESHPQILHHRKRFMSLYKDFLDKKLKRLQKQ